MDPYGGITDIDTPSRPQRGATQLDGTQRHPSHFTMWKGPTMCDTERQSPYLTLVWDDGQMWDDVIPHKPGHPTNVG